MKISSVTTMSKPKELTNKMLYMYIHYLDDKIVDQRWSTVNKEGNAVLCC